MGLGSGRDAYLHLRVDASEHLCALVGCLRPEQVFLVNHHHYGQPQLLTGAARYLVERGRLLRVAHHQVLVLVDALPVHEEYLARLYHAVGLVQLVVHHGP